MEKKRKRGLLFLMSVVLGGFLGGFVGMFKAATESHEIMLDVKVLIPWISAICLLIGFISILLTFNFLKKSRKFHSLYQEEMDDDLNETYYVQMYRNLEFGTIAFNSASVAILLALFISGSEVIVLDISHITLSLSFLGLVLVLNAQKISFLRPLRLFVSLIWHFSLHQRMSWTLSILTMKGSARLIWNRVFGFYSN